MMKKKCESPYCRNNPYKRKFCSSCRSRSSRRNNPALYCFVALRNNAKRRGIAFDLTFDQFKSFARETLYIAGKGRRKESLTIDRIDNAKGYTIDNIQTLTKSQNSSKGAKILQYDYYTKYATVMDSIQMQAGL